jgi:hypothetical protein
MYVTFLSPAELFEHINVMRGPRGSDVTLLERYYKLSFPNTNLPFEWRTLLTQTRLW